jgi:hypothetical protein
VDWINPTGAKKVHSLSDKVYQRKNLEMAWEMLKANRGSGGVDAEYLQEVRAVLEPQLRESTGTWVADYVRLRFAATRATPLR